MAEVIKEENRMSDRQAALDMALKQIEKQFGKGSIMKLGEQTETRI
ncbi:DNA recombination/repair protein RecA, partial [Bacillus haynesii]|nr:DNA recombination/repair protein RecA [Bacillus haynesii]